MLMHDIMEREGALKEAALAACSASDWPGLLNAARSLVALYNAVLATGEVSPEAVPRWVGLRARWTGIAGEAERRARESAGKAAASAAKAEPARVIPQAEARQQAEAGLEAVPPPARSPVAPGNAAGAPDHADSGAGSNGGGQSAAANTGITLDDVKGLVGAKRVVMDSLVNPVRHPDIYKALRIKNGKGLLLYGPPGTGKTMFARAVAGELGLPFLYRKMSDLKDKYVGESEKNISNLFAEASSHKRCVIFLDECESILRKRGNQKICIVEQFLQEIDGFATKRDSQIFVILATNRPWLIDSAVLRSGRIGLAVHVGLPDPETRRAILDAALRGIPLADDVSMDDLVALTEGFSGAEIHHGDGGGVCDESQMSAGRRWVARREGLSPDDPDWSRVEKVTRADFDAAFRAIVPVSRKDPEIIRQNREFSIGGGAASAAGDPDDAE